MGTYTANKNLYMPTVGEQGWGDLMNTNLSTIDTFLKPITVSGSTYTFTGNHVGNQSGGTITATKITNSGTLTQTGTSTFTGKITANGGIGTKALSATSISNSGTLTQTGMSTFTGKITANGGVNDYEERITALENGEYDEGVVLENGLKDTTLTNCVYTFTGNQTSGYPYYIYDDGINQSSGGTLMTRATIYIPDSNYIKFTNSSFTATLVLTGYTTTTITTWRVLKDGAVLKSGSGDCNTTFSVIIGSTYEVQYKLYADHGSVTTTSLICNVYI